MMQGAGNTIKHWISTPITMMTTHIFSAVLASTSEKTPSALDLPKNLELDVQAEPDAVEVGTTEFVGLINPDINPVLWEFLPLREVVNLNRTCKSLQAQFTKHRQAYEKQVCEVIKACSELKQYCRATGRAGTSRPLKILI